MTAGLVILRWLLRLKKINKWFCEGFWGAIRAPRHFKGLTGFCVYRFEKVKPYNGSSLKCSIAFFALLRHSSPSCRNAHHDSPAVAANFSSTSGLPHKILI
jgi:hypothetical protein